MAFGGDEYDSTFGGGGYGFGQDQTVSAGGPSDNDPYGGPRGGGGLKFTGFKNRQAALKWGGRNPNALGPNEWANLIRANPAAAKAYAEMQRDLPMRSGGGVSSPAWSRYQNEVKRLKQQGFDVGETPSPEEDNTPPPEDSIWSPKPNYPSTGQASPPGQIVGFPWIELFAPPQGPTTPRDPLPGLRKPGSYEGDVIDRQYNPVGPVGNQQPQAFNIMDFINMIGNSRAMGQGLGQPRGLGMNFGNIFKGIAPNAFGNLIKSLGQPEARAEQSEGPPPGWTGQGWL